MHARLRAHRDARIPIRSQRVALTALLNRPLLHKSVSLNLRAIVDPVLGTTRGDIEAPGVLFYLVGLLLSNSHCCCVTKIEKVVTF